MQVQGQVMASDFDAYRSTMSVQFSNWSAATNNNTLPSYMTVFIAHRSLRRLPVLMDTVRTTYVVGRSVCVIK
jgi:hypothetical protein